MLYAVLSDIHANFEALRAVLDAADARRVDRIVCLGDLVGYHADPNACIEVILRRGIPCVRGNHDAVAAGLKEPVDFSETARKAILWTRPWLTPQSLQYLRELPLVRVMEHFVMVHAALHPQPNEELRLRTEADAAESFAVFCRDYPMERLCFFGHTHRPAAYAWEDGNVRRCEEKRVMLRPGTRYLVNPGSVGQSRDTDPRAAFLLLDTATGMIEFCRIGYDRRTSLRKARCTGLLCRPGLLRRSVGWMRRRLRAARPAAASSANLPAAVTGDRA